MSSRRTNTKQEMLLSTVELPRERGSAAVTIDAILARSNTPRGSVYYHFPNGRGEILAQALDMAGDGIGSLIEAATVEGGQSPRSNSFTPFGRPSFGTQTSTPDAR